jgi:mannose/cellobiose epimerase-like protein (N-acyl-D-glucosamine 2-epimerase family)
MTTACITTATTEITTTKTAAELLSDTLGHAWAAVRGGYVISGGMDHSAHYDAAVWTACRSLMDAGLALEAVVEEAAARMGVDMDNVLSLCADREACVG